MKRLQAILQMKCPHCLQGAVFHKPFVMYPTCAECSIRYERERGYFMMAVFVGYVMGVAVVLPFLLFLYLVIRPDVMGYIAGAVIVLLLATPLIFHYARVVWMHLDELMDPRLAP